MPLVVLAMFTPMILALHTLGKDGASLQLEEQAADMPELNESGVTGKIVLNLEILPLEGDSYLVQGETEGDLNVECGRCLEPFLQPFELKFNLLLDRKQSTGIEWVDDEDQGVEDYQAKLGPDVTEVPLNAIIAEQVVLNYNLHPLPDVDEAGRCVQCGRPAVLAPTPKKEVGVDPRWAKLGNLKDVSEKDGSKKPGSGN
jgi:uncharacterized metal-binding protein YceD (DUF177 family)